VRPSSVSAGANAVAKRRRQSRRTADGTSHAERASQSGSKLRGSKLRGSDDRGSPAGGWSGGVEPVDTHLFLSGEESEETYEKLMTVAARTCYLHATLGAALPPEIAVVHGEQAAA